MCQPERFPNECNSTPERRGTGTHSGWEEGCADATSPLHSSDAPSSLARCLQNYIPAQSLTLSCPVCRQTSILPEQGVSALQNNFFISSLMEAMQQAPDGAHDPEDPHPLSAVAGRPLSCPNHEGKVGPSRPSEARTWGGGAGAVGGGG